MKKIIPKEFLDVLTDIRKQRNFQLIKSIIEENWGFDVVSNSKDFSKRFYYGLFTLDYSETISVEFGDEIRDLENPKTQSTDGILTFDRTHNRFVIFQIVDKFTGFENVEQMISSVIKKDGYYGSWVIDKETILRFSSHDINYELTKLIVLSFEISTIQLLSYLSTDHPKIGFGRGYELWKIDSLKDQVYIEKVQNDFNEDTDGCQVKELSFFSKYSYSDNLINRYNLFKEYLRFKFNCKLNLTSDINFPKLNQFIENLPDSQDVDYFDEGELNVTEDSLQSFIENIVKLNNKNSSQLLTIPDSFDFRNIKLDVLTQGLEFDLSFIITFETQVVNVSMFFWDKSIKYRHLKYVFQGSINESNTYQDFDYFVNPIFEIFEEYRKEKIEDQLRRDREIEDQKQKSVDNDLPF